MARRAVWLFRLNHSAKYYAPDGAAWAYERQALVKLRPITGDIELSNELCRLRDIYAYESGSFDVTAMRAMRERQVRHLVTGGTFNAKFSPGGLVDIEYLIQGLQINHGAQNHCFAFNEFTRCHVCIARCRNSFG